MEENKGKDIVLKVISHYYFFSGALCGPSGPPSNDIQCYFLSAPYFCIYPNKEVVFHDGYILLVHCFFLSNELFMSLNITTRLCS